MGSRFHFPATQEPCAIMHQKKSLFSPVLSELLSGMEPKFPRVFRLALAKNECEKKTFLFSGSGANSFSPVPHPVSHSGSSALL
jgi:hypothetical protein